MKIKISPKNKAVNKIKKRSALETEKKIKKIIPWEFHRPKIYFDKNGNIKPNLTEIEIE
jgi:hypothetical protein